MSLMRSNDNEQLKVKGHLHGREMFPSEKNTPSHM